MNELGKLIRTAREAKAWSLPQASAETGISAKRLESYEQGEQLPGYEHSQKLVYAYGLDARQFLFCGSGGQEPAKKPGKAENSGMPEGQKRTMRSVYEAHIMQFMHEEEQRKNHDHDPCNRQK